MNYYIAKVEIKIDSDGEKGVKKSTEIYVVDAMSPTEVEAKITKEFKDTTMDYSISSITKSKIIKIL